MGEGLQRYAADPNVVLTVARFSFRCGDESHRRIVSRARGRYDRDVDNTTECLSPVFTVASGGGKRSCVHRHTIIVTIADARRE